MTAKLCERLSGPIDKLAERCFAEITRLDNVMAKALQGMSTLEAQLCKLEIRMDEVLFPPSPGLATSLLCGGDFVTCAASSDVAPPPRDGTFVEEENSESTADLVQGPL